MNNRIKKKVYKRAYVKLLALKGRDDTRSLYDIAKKSSVLSPKEKAVFLTEEERWIQMVQKTLNEIDGEEAKKWYNANYHNFDEDGFIRFRMAESLLGKFSYAHFAYEDLKGLFEDMNGHQLLPYLLVQHAHKLGQPFVERWEEVSPCYERCINLSIDENTPKFKHFELKLYLQIRKDTLWKNSKSS